LLEKQHEWSGTSQELLEALGAGERRTAAEKKLAKMRGPSGPLRRLAPHCGALASTINADRARLVGELSC
jgi:hypothetical protein